MSLTVKTASIALIVICAALESRSEPAVYELKLVYIFESANTEFIFVIGNSGFRNVDSLKRFLGSLPAGTTIRWAPGCERFGGEPLLSSEEEMAEFQAFCRDHRIKLILVPSG